MDEHEICLLDREEPALDPIQPDDVPVASAYEGDDEQSFRILEHRIEELEAWRNSLDAEETTTASLAARLTSLPTAAGLYVFEAPGFGGRRFRITRYYGDLEAAVRAAQNWWPPRSAYSVGGASWMWRVRFPKATGAQAKETVPSGERQYDPLTFIPLAAEFIAL